MLSKLYNSNPEAAGAFIILVLGLTALVIIASSGVHISPGEYASWLGDIQLQHQIITPTPGIECAVVTFTDGSSIDCWKVDG